MNNPNHSRRVTAIWFIWSRRSVSCVWFDERERYKTDPLTGSTAVVRPHLTENSHKIVVVAREYLRALGLRGSVGSRSSPITLNGFSECPCCPAQKLPYL